MQLLFIQQKDRKADIYQGHKTKLIFSPGRIDSLESTTDIDHGRSHEITNRGVAETKLLLLYFYRDRAMRFS